MFPINNNFNNFRSSILTYIYAQESSVIGRQRVAIFVYSCTLLIMGVILNLCGVTGPISTFFQIANTTQGVLFVAGLYLYYKRLISLSAAMSLCCIVAQVEISAETIYCALNNSTYKLALIIANVALSSVVLLLGIISYLRIIPFIIAVLSLGTYIFSIYWTGSVELENFFVVFLIIYVTLILMGRTMIHNVSRLDKENTQLKDERREMLDVFDLTDSEMRSYMTLAKTKNLEPDKTAEILATVGDIAEKRILDNVAHYVRQSAIDFEKLHERLPELSASELEICSLILKEKKLKEITELLGKSRSNITCQRTNIRAKLNMKPEDKLYEVLKKRMEVTS